MSLMYEIHFYVGKFVMPHRTLRALLSFFVLLCLGAASSPAWANSSSLYPPSDLVFTLAQSDGTDPDAPIVRAATLTCMPRVAGSHPFAEEACELLEDAEGSITDLIGHRRLCTKEYMPVTVTADGVWQGQRVTYEETFANRCTLLRERGTVFDF
ncbi:SSI family serine proteinase inhibitor [Streptomyces syringium]|uniref:SSI family serine proteinase inhibitor n=1 Tax=Streptomyces syringium TaxID=76729 RepID=UPI00342798DD